MRGLAEAGRPPRTIVLENVYGCLTSHAGKDFAAIGSALSSSEYRFGAIVINASRFVPQSRPRVFFIAIERNELVPNELVSDGPDLQWHPQALVDAYAGMSPSAKKRWIWWKAPAPPARNTHFADLIEEKPTGVDWHSPRRRTIFSVSCRPSIVRRLRRRRCRQSELSEAFIGVRDPTRMARSASELRFASMISRDACARLSAVRPVSPFSS